MIIFCAKDQAVSRRPGTKIQPFPEELVEQCAAQAQVRVQFPFSPKCFFVLRDCASCNLLLSALAQCTQPPVASLHLSSRMLQECKYIEQESIQRRFDYLVMYYVSSGQTSLLQVRLLA